LSTEIKIYEYRNVTDPTPPTDPGAVILETPPEFPPGVPNPDTAGPPGAGDVDPGVPVIPKELIELGPTPPDP
jgi:hypothetical protein